MSRMTTYMIQLTTWSRAIGQKLLDKTLDPDQVLQGTLVPKFITARPNKMPIAVEWPEIFFKEPENAFSFFIKGKDTWLNDTSISLHDPSDTGPLAFAIESENGAATFELSLNETNGYPDFTIRGIQNSAVMIKFLSK